MWCFCLAELYTSLGLFVHDQMCYHSSFSFFQRLPDVVNMEDLSRKDLVSESSKVEQLTAENQSLQSRVQQLQEAVPPAGVSIEEKEELLAEITRLKEFSRSASKVSVEYRVHIERENRADSSRESLITILVTSVRT